MKIRWSLPAPSTWLLVVGLLLPCWRTAFAQAEESNEGNLEELREFLQNRPAIENLLVKVLSGKPERVQATAKNVHKPYIHLHGAWQDGDFWVRTVDGEFTNSFVLGPDTKFLVGRSENTIWQAGPTYAAKAVFPDKASVPLSDQRDKNPIGIAARMGDAILSRALNLGLLRIVPGSFKFSDSATFEVSVAGDRIADGKFLFEGKRVTGLRYQVRGDGPYCIYKYEYDDKRPIPGFLPYKITKNVYGAGNEFLRVADEIEFLQLTPAEKPIAGSHFLPDRIYPSQPKKPFFRIFYTNDQFVYEANGQLFPVMTQQAFSTPSSKGKTVFFAALLAILGLPILLVIVRRSINEAQKSNTN